MTNQKMIEIFKSKLKAMEGGGLCCNFGDSDKEAFLTAIKFFETSVTKDAVIDALNDWADHSVTQEEEWHLRQVAGDIRSM